MNWLPMATHDFSDVAHLVVASCCIMLDSRVCLLGDRQVVKAEAFVNEFLSYEQQFEITEPNSDAGPASKRIAILCSALYSSKATLQECQHWIPGFQASDVGDTDRQKAWLEEVIRQDKQIFDQKTADLMVEKLALQSEESEPDEVALLVGAIDDQVEHLSVVHDNLVALLWGLWRDHGILAKPTQSDGNCGVHTVIAFCEGNVGACMKGPDAAPFHMKQLVASYRNEIATMWEEVCCCVLWQEIFERFIHDRVDLSRWRLQADPVPETPNKGPKKNKCGGSATPNAKKKARRTPFTPDKKGSALVSQPEEPIESAKVKLSPAVPQKKKRTGKKSPPEQIASFDTYFERYVAEKGITYRRYLEKHRAQHAIVWLVSVSVG